MQMTTRTTVRASTSALFAAAATMLAPVAAAQCSADWQGGFGWAGVSGSVNAMVEWDPDGAGPLPSLVAIGGNYSLAGTVAIHSIAAYDPQTSAWSPLGPGFPLYTTVNDLVVLAGGELVASIKTQLVPGGSSTSSIVQWNGTSWVDLQAPASGLYDSMAVMPNDDLVVANPSWNGGSSGTVITRWDGNTWTDIATSVDNVVTSLQAMPNGDLVAGGSFTVIDGVAAQCVARWDGSSWSPMAAGITPGPTVWPYLPAGVKALALLPNGDLLAGGHFATAGRPMQRWDGNGWSDYGTGWYAKIEAIAVDAAGDVTAVASNTTMHIASTNGTNWQAVAVATGWPTGYMFDVLATSGGHLLVGGRFQTVDGVAAESVARRDRTTWSPLSPAGFDNAVLAATARPNGDVIIGGYFRKFGDVTLNGVARFDGTTVHAMGAGLTLNGYPRAAQCLATLPNGDIVVGGSFDSAGGVPVQNIARWNGSSWSAVGNGLGFQVGTLAVAANGDLLAQSLGLWRFDGTSWTQLPAPTGGVGAIAGMPNGDIIVAGNSYVERWDGSSWTVLATSPSSIFYTILPLSDDTFVIGGSFHHIEYVPMSGTALWDGNGFTPFGNFTNPVNSSHRVYDLLQLPNGDIVAGGRFETVDGVSAACIARKVGGTWQPFGDGIHTTSPNGTGGWWDVHALAFSNRGQLIAGGSFGAAGPHVSVELAVLEATCPATTTTIGNGCAGTGGLNVLAGEERAWAGSTYAATATGLGNGLTVGVRGFGQVNVPLNTVFAEALPGCALLASPDVLDLYVPIGGVVRSEFGLPNIPALAGLFVIQQMVTLELSPTGIDAVTATNALRVTIGAF